MITQNAITEYQTYIATYMQPSSQRVYKNRLAGFFAALDTDKELASITRADVDAATVAYRATHSNNTVRLYVTVIRSFFAWCVDEGYIDRSPAVRLRRPRTPRRTPRAVPAPLLHELEAKLAGIDTKKWHDRRNVAIIRFILNTGLRRSEILSLRWSDVMERYVRITGKGDKERIIPLNGAAQAALAMVRRDDGRGHVFGHANGLPLHAESLDVVFKRWLVRNGLNYVGLHRLRHTFATQLLARGVTIYDIRDLLGHESVKTTEIYLSADGERLREAVESL
jgi:site-specific recombinase XerD